MTPFLIYLVKILYITVTIVATAMSVESLTPVPKRQHHQDYLKPMFSIKTPYSFIEDTGEDALVVKRPMASCKVKQLNVIHRHGHRLPSKNYIMRFKELSEKINWKGRRSAASSPGTRKKYNDEDKLNWKDRPSAPSIKFNENDVSGIKYSGDKFQTADLRNADDDSILGLPWDPPLDEEHKNHLTEVGQHELYRIGVRMQKRFPELFRKRYNARRFKFISTNKIRTTHSANSLAAGLFDGDGSIHSRIQPIALEITSSDCRILRFYDNCEVYKREIENNPRALIEYQRFLESDHMKRVALKVKDKLRKLDGDFIVVDDRALTHRDLDAIFVGCAYEMSMFDGSIDKGLCGLLDEQDQMVLEYAEDLQNFYLTSNPLNPLTYMIACPLLKDIINKMQDAAEDKSLLQGIFRSAHSTAVLMLYTLLGLNQQHSPPLTSDNFEEQIVNKDRFRSSNVSPFAGNANFVLYDCGSGGGRMKVQLYWNERLQKLPCCQSEVDCDFKDFVDYFQKQIEKCESEDLCKQKKEESAWRAEDESDQVEKEALQRKVSHELGENDQRSSLSQPRNIQLFPSTPSSKTDESDTEENNQQSSLLVTLFTVFTFIISLLKNFLVNWIGRNLNRFYPKQE